MEPKIVSSTVLELSPLVENGPDDQASGILDPPQAEFCTVVTDTPTNDEPGQNMAHPDLEGRTGLHQAVEAGNIDEVQSRLNAQEDVNAKYGQGITPLHLAAVNVSKDDPEGMSRYERIVDILVDASASVCEVRGDTGETALYDAVTLGSCNATRRLLEGGADPTAPCTSLGMTPLHIAASAGFHNILNILLERSNSSKINKHDEFGRTPLHAAAYRGHVECIRALVDHGGSLAAENKDGETVLDAIFDHVALPVTFLTDILDARVRATDNAKISLDFRVLAPQGKLQMEVISALIEAVPFMEQMTIVQHPLVEAFLGLKWSRLRVFFYALVIVYGCLVLYLSVFTIAVLHGSQIPCLLSRTLLFSYAGMLILSGVLVLYISPRVYARQFETWLSMICAVISIVVAVVAECKTSPAAGGSANPSWVMQLLSIAILFAWTQMMLVVSQFPTWGYYALMFSTVSKNVLKVLLAFVWLIVGFALSFSVLFHENKQFFDPLRTFVKTVVMMMGEYDYDNLFESLDNTNGWNSDENQTHHINVSNASETSGGILLPATSRIIFLIFVILASIVLMNLMIGLAVNDIQGLWKEGNITRLMKQVNFIGILEWVGTSSIYRCRFMPRPLKTMLDFEQLFPTEVTLEMRSGNGRRTHGISEGLLKVLSKLASKNRVLDQKFQTETIIGEKKISFAETISALQAEIRSLKQFERQTLRMQSTRIKFGKRRQS